MSKIELSNKETQSGWIVAVAIIIALALIYFVPNVVSELKNHSGHSVQISNPG